MKLQMQIEFSNTVPKEVLEDYGKRLEQQMTTIYHNTPGVSKEFKGITTKVIE